MINKAKNAKRILAVRPQDNITRDLTAELSIDSDLDHDLNLNDLDSEPEDSQDRSLCFVSPNLDTNLDSNTCPRSNHSKFQTFNLDFHSPNRNNCSNDLCKTFNSDPNNDLDDLIYLTLEEMDIDELLREELDISPLKFWNEEENGRWYLDSDEDNENTEDNQ